MGSRNDLGAATGLGELVAGPTQGQELVVDRERCRQPVLVRVERQLRGAERPNTADQLGKQGPLAAHDLDQTLDLRPEDHILEDRVAAKQKRRGTSLCPAFRLLRQAQAGFPQLPSERGRRHVGQDRVALLLHVVDVPGHAEPLYGRRHFVRQVERLSGLRQPFRRRPRLFPGCRRFELRGSGLRHRRTPHSIQVGSRWSARS